MKISKETFVEKFVELCIECGKVYDDKDYTVSPKEHNKTYNKLRTKQFKQVDVLIKNPAFAKEVLDALIEHEGFWVMKYTAYTLWEFNYRMEDCCRLLDKILTYKGQRKYGLSVILMDVFYSNIKDGNPHQKRRKEFPKLD